MGRRLVTALCLCVTLSANAAEELTLIERIRQSEGSIPLNTDDPSLTKWAQKRDFSQDPPRQAGPINVQRQDGGLAYVGIPTFFKQPVALTPEDLRAGDVDVAIMGASLDMSSGRRGAAYGPNAIRVSENYVPWGKVFHTESENVLVDPFNVLNVVDYGDAPIDFVSTERSIVPVYDQVKEIAETGTVPVIVGGDHSLMYPGRRCTRVGLRQGENRGRAFRCTYRRGGRWHGSLPHARLSGAAIDRGGPRQGAKLRSDRIARLARFRGDARLDARAGGALPLHGRGAA